MKRCKYINDYILALRSKNIPACKEILQACDLIENKLKDVDVIVDVQKIDSAVELIERYFDFKLLDWELFILALVHCYYKSTNTVVWDEYFIMMGRGNGKNGFISTLAWYFTTKNHGVKGYNVDIIANSEDQAETSFNDIYEMLENTWSKSKRFFYKSKVLIKSLYTNSYIKFNTSNARTKDGKRSACLIFDEIHEYENYNSIRVFTSGFGKRKHSRTFYITTDGYVRDGVLDDEKTTARDILSGNIKNSKTLPLIYKLDDIKEIDEPKMWVKANPSLLYFPELQIEMDKAYEKKNYKQHIKEDFFTKRMNLPVSDAAVAITDWSNIDATNKPIPDLTGKSCTVGIDYAKVTDLMSVNLHFEVENECYDINHSWLCRHSSDITRLRVPWESWAEEGILTVVDDIEISPLLIANYVYEAAQKYDILGIAIDNFRFALISRALDDIGFNKKDIKLVRPSDIYIVFPVIESLFTNQRFIWGDNPVLRWATYNTKVMRGHTGNHYYDKIEPRSRKTDPFMALVHSVIIADKLNEGNLDFTSLPPPITA